MTLEQGIDSLKLECALRNLGFVNIHNTVVANCGIYFIRPIGFNTLNVLDDDLYGYQLSEPAQMMDDFLLRKLHLRFASSAKIAFDRAENG